MNKYVLCFSCSIALSHFSFSQATDIFEKECRISAGGGISGTFHNFRAPGLDTWYQLDYRFLRNISVAMEFDDQNYSMPGYYDLPFINPNKVMVYDNNFSILLKYHFRADKKLKVAVAGGWSWCIVQNDYYLLTSTGTSTEFIRNVSSFNDLSIPFLLEINYPLSPTVAVTTRLKYNLSIQVNPAWTTTAGLSIKL